MGILSYGYKAIKSVKPKPISKATKKFKRSIETTKKAVKKGTDDFQKKNPKSLVTDKDIKKVQKDTAEKYNKKSRKEYLRERKMGGGMMGRPMYKKGGKSFPDLTGDGKVTKKDILKGRGVPGFARGSEGPVRKKSKKNFMEKISPKLLGTGRARPLKHLKEKLKNR